jgi:hypothetical protein
LAGLDRAWNDGGDGARDGGQGGRTAPTFGPEVWSALADHEWTYWGPVVSVVAVLDHAGSLDGREARPVADLRDHRGDREEESKLSHLGDLRAWLADAGLSPADLAPARLLTTGPSSPGRARRSPTAGSRAGRRRRPCATPRAPAFAAAPDTDTGTRFRRTPARRATN